MMFVSYSYHNPLTRHSGFGNEVLDDTIPPTTQLDLINLAVKIEEYHGASTSITILNWKMM